jgi:hypothetical protein
MASFVPSMEAIITACKNFGGILHVEVLEEFSPYSWPSPL